MCSLPLATHARSGGIWVAPADVHGTLGGIYGCLRNLRGPTDGKKKTNLRLRNGDLDGFRRIFVDFDGVRRILAGFCATPWFSGGCLTICELCCVPTSCPIYCLVLPLPVSPPPQRSTSKICKLLPVVTSNVKKKQRHQIRKPGFPKTGAVLFLINFFV